ncbi:protein MAIN-LIKE 1-like [Malania oleifera]|uniref:protein MAIN-LIKE 1-like n=1 Tax=Malania oleifera TaxID=397392 RepID=UPI0025AEB163|nr:protein MAIN-LIKE 1-like [Malania oleifera]
MKKATRKSCAGGASRRNSVGNFSTRFSLPSFFKRVEKLTDDQRIAIQRIGFGNLLLIPNLTVSKKLLVELMERWNCKKHAFILSPGEITITLLDVALILGIRVIGEPVVLKDDEPFSELEREYGAVIWKRKVTVASIESRLESFSGVASDDFVRTFLLFMFGTFLFPNASGKIESRYLSFLKDLGTVHQYAWGAAVVEDLFKWLCKRKEMNVQYVGGCLILLQIWCYEHIDIGRPSLADCCLTFPRACRWVNDRSLFRQWLSTKFKELQENQIIWKLQPTPEELGTNIIKELLEAQSNEELPLVLLSSTDASSSNGGDSRFTSQALDQQAVELESDSEMDMTEECGVQEDNLEQLRSPQYVPEVLVDNIEYPLAPNYVSEDDGLRIKNQILEEQNVDLKKEIDRLRRENKLLRNQVLSSSMSAQQNVVLKEEIEDLRRENQLLISSSDGLVARLEKLLLDEDSIAREEHSSPFRELALSSQTEVELKLIYRE